MKKRMKREAPKKKQERLFTLYDCCWYGPYEHTLCCGGFCPTGEKKEDLAFRREKGDFFIHPRAISG
jgi:hypothetical protein